MKNNFTFSLIALMMSVIFCNVNAQNNTKVKLFEFEIGGGMTIGSNYGTLKAAPGVNSYLEARTNLKDTPWDLGFQLGLGYMNRKDEHKISYNVTNKFSMLAFADYNFRYWDKVAPFAGIGLGRTELFYDTPGAIGSDGKPSVYEQVFSPIVLNPRIGVEFFDHLRITAEYKMNFHNKCNWFALNVGFAFGGGKKK